MEKTRRIEILLVEDDQGDVDLTTEALEGSKLPLSLNVVRDGFEAMEYLHRRGRFAKAPKPDIILLDLNMPRKDGRQVLREIREDPDLAPIPVIVLTASAADEDILRSYELRCNCYLTKPVKLAEFMKVVRVVGDFWATVVKLPGRDE